MRQFSIAAIFGILTWSAAASAGAQAPARTIEGKVSAAATGSPVRDAVLSLETPAGVKIASARTDLVGTFVFSAPSPGNYRIDVTAAGYEHKSIALRVTLAGSQHTEILLTGEGPVSEIGRVVSHPSDIGRAEPGQHVSASTLANGGALRPAEMLGKLSGVNVSGDIGAPGGDAYVSLRGLRPGESQTLLDGHPVGPIGISSDAPDADGTVAGFNYQDAPYFALRGIDVTFGAGSDALGGTVNLLTYEPTERNEFVFEQGFGNEGRAVTAIRATGTAGKFGYALVHGVVGTYGLFSGGDVAQTGIRGTDFTSATLRDLTYRVSGDYVLRNELAKVTYAPVPATRIELSTYDATSWADKTGEGDNDFNSFNYVLANAPVGAAPMCPHGVLVTTDAGPACESPRAYAAAASGPAGGGPGAWQALRNQDADVRLTTAVGGNSAFAVDAFADRYALLYHRDASLASGPLDAFLTRWSTQGVRLSDDITGRTNAFGFGVSWLQQSLSGDGTTPDGAALTADTPARRIDRRAFVRDTFSAGRRLSLIVDASLKSSSIDTRTRLDPQFSVLYRPTTRDTIHLGIGRSSEDPSLETDRVDLLPVGALNPDCGAIAQAGSGSPAAVNVGSAPAQGLAAETGSDLEAGFSHRFGADGNVGITLYDTNVRDRIVTGDFAAGGLLAASSIPPLLARISQFCGLSPDPRDVTFTLSRSFNVATARLRGLEIAGHVRMSPNVSIDYGFDVQSIVLNDLPASALITDPTLVNGLQAFGVPLHKATLGVAALTRGGLECRLDAHAVGPNNSQQLPGYAYADASIARSISKHATLLLTATNVLGSHAQSYGLVGSGVPYAVNSYNAALGTPFLQPFNERYGLQPTAVTLGATLHL